MWSSHLGKGHIRFCAQPEEPARCDPVPKLLLFFYIARREHHDAVEYDYPACPETATVESQYELNQGENGEQSSACHGDADIETVNVIIARGTAHAILGVSKELFTVSDKGHQVRG